MKTTCRSSIPGFGPHARRGMSLYITVMSTALIASLLGLAGLTIVRIERKQTVTNSDILSARTNAASAVELALRVLANDPNWRTNYTSGVETVPQSLGPNAIGTLSWVLEDSDGSLTDGDTKLRLKGVGRVGNTVQVSSLGFTTSGSAMNCLEVAVCSNGDASFSSSSIVSTDQTIHSNGSVSVSSGGIVNSDVEAVGTISGSGTYNGTTVSPVSARAVPNASVFDYYISNGTYIEYSALPKAGPAQLLSDVVLSPNSNPYGDRNPEGIYIIDCKGGQLRIKCARIIGTLVLLDIDHLSDIEDGMSWEPAISNYPALLVQGGIEFRLTTDGLSEVDRGVNFNPPGSPYQGSTDSDTVDTYPSQIKGLVYVSGNAGVKNGDTVIDGVLVAGNQLNVTSGETLTVTYDSQFFSNPPPGFSQGNTIDVTAQTWLWDAAP